MDVSYFDAVTAWLEQHNDWLGIVIFLVAMVESLVAIGIVVPGVAMLFALGVIAGTGALDIYSTLAWAFAGAVVGDGVSYWLGYRYHGRLRGWWPFKQHPQWLEHGEKFFTKYGLLSVVIGRFVGPVRPIVPVVAGMMDMPPVKFYTVNILSAVGWAPVYLLPGFFTGAALAMGDQFPDQLFYVFAGVVVLAVILSGAFCWAQQRYQRLITWGALCCLMLYIFLLVAYVVGAEDAMNLWVHQWLMPLRVDWLVTAMEYTTLLGTLPILLPVMVAVFVWLYFKNNVRDMKPLLWVIPAMESVLWLSKMQVNNPRPENLEGLDQFSFPSGHTTQAAFFFCWIAAQLSDSMSYKKKWLVQSVALTLVFMVALSRMLLNVHWVGDVLAGLCLGLFWVAVSRLYKYPVNCFRIL